MGDDAALDALVGDTLTELNEDGITTLRPRGVYCRDALISANFPNLQQIGNYGFASCANLTTIDIGANKASGFSYDAFSGSTKLRHLVLRGSAKPTSLSYSFIQQMNNEIRWGNGAVYVPSDLVSSYRNDSVWGYFTILPLSEYPSSTYGAIQDSWEDILEAESDGTYLTKYHIGDKKLVNIGDSSHWFKIIAFDTDELVSGGTAKITWKINDASETHKMNTSGTTGGWENSLLRAWLSDSMLPTLPSELQSAIKTVVKTYYDYNTSSTLSCNDKLFVPSCRELGRSGSNYESSGCVYSQWTSNRWFAFNAKTSTSPYSQWTRTSYTNNNFRTFTNGSSVSSYPVSQTNVGVPICFCT